MLIFFHWVFLVGVDKIPNGFYVIADFDTDAGLALAKEALNFVVSNLLSLHVDITNTIHHKRATTHIRA